MHEKPAINRRSFLYSGAAAAAATLIGPSTFAQSQRLPIGPEPIRYPSGVWKVLDERFRKYMIGNTPLVREWTGSL
ncbi:MAG: twin-arginine translocation signal domain-containing protein, partial [Acidobacteria bacterium]